MQWKGLCDLMSCVQFYTPHPHTHTLTRCSGLTDYSRFSKTKKYFCPNFSNILPGMAISKLSRLSCSGILLWPKIAISLEKLSKSYTLANPSADAGLHVGDKVHRPLKCGVKRFLMCRLVLLLCIQAVLVWIINTTLLQFITQTTANSRYKTPSSFTPLHFPFLSSYSLNEARFPTRFDNLQFEANAKHI